MASSNSQAMLDKFAEVSAKVGNQVHLRSLRDAFATITPLYICLLYTSPSPRD